MTKGKTRSDLLKRGSRGMLVAAALVLAISVMGCESITKSTVSASPGVQELQPRVYAILPIEVQATPTDQGWAEVEPQGAETISSMMTAKLTGLLPVVVDRGRVNEVLEEIQFQTLSGLTVDDRSKIGGILNADAIVSIYLGEYNASRVSIAATATHVETGAVLWSGDVTAKTGWISLDTESTAERAVDNFASELEKDLSQ